MGGRICRDTIALGIAGAIVGMHVYMLMSPRKQHEIERNMRKTANELRDIAHDMGKTIKSL